MEAASVDPGLPQAEHADAMELGWIHLRKLAPDAHGELFCSACTWISHD